MGKKWVEMAEDYINYALTHLKDGDWSMAVWYLANAIEALMNAYDNEEFKEAGE